jgi:hypothetical protein
MGRIDYMFMRIFHDIFLLRVPVFLDILNEFTNSDKFGM